jgi:chemotaxis regulatin CheY-phosphate phosphatase CheZ
MSLQVQDITAQHLAAVNHLIISVQHKLSKLLAVFNLADEDSFSKDNLELPGTHFDANASYDKSSNDQDLVDSVISGEKASQDDIDKLFS